MSSQSHKPDVSTFQGLILALQQFWADNGCVIVQPLDLEVGAGTSHPETLFRVLGPKPWSVAYVQPSRRPDDGRICRSASNREEPSGRSLERLMRLEDQTTPPTSEINTGSSPDTAGRRTGADPAVRGEWVLR